MGARESGSVPGHALRHGTAVLAWAREQRMVRLVLNPSEVSLPLYRGLGFQPADNLMRLDL